jgi:hypothetical protein
LDQHQSGQAAQQKQAEVPRHAQDRFDLHRTYRLFVGYSTTVKRCGPTGILPHGCGIVWLYGPFTAVSLVSSQVRVTAQKRGKSRFWRVLYRSSPLVPILLLLPFAVLPKWKDSGHTQWQARAGDAPEGFERAPLW